MALTSLDYQITGDIPIIQQPNGMACWATVATMLMSWRDQQCYSIETAMEIAGPEYARMFNKEEGLPAENHQQFAKACGMTVEYPECYTPEGLYDLLVNYGPIIVITDEDTSPYFAIHARILKGIHSDADAETSYLSLIDPADGSQYDENFEDFTLKFEAVAEAPRLQVMHF